jgi:hypothetical protein
MEKAALAREPLEYPDYIARLREHAPDLAEEFAAFHGVTSVLDWMKARYDGRVAIDMVSQDEFNYDFLIELEPGGRWVAFGVT